MKHEPITNVAEMEKLIAEGLLEQDILDGYREGFDGGPEPGMNRSRLFYHGWRNGAMDKGFIPMDAASSLFAADYIRKR